MADRKWTDAKFEVVQQPPKPIKRRGWWFDWRNFLIVGGLSAAVAANLAPGGGVVHLPGPAVRGELVIHGLP